MLTGINIRWGNPGMHTKTPSFSQDLVLLNDLLEESPPPGCAVSPSKTPKTPKTPASPAPLIEDEISMHNCASPTHATLMQVSDYLKSFDTER